MWLAMKRGSIITHENLECSCVILGLQTRSARWKVMKKEVILVHLKIGNPEILHI